MEAQFDGTNRLVDYLALREIALAGDGRAFDEHLVDMLENSTQEELIRQPRLLPRIETRRGLSAATYSTSHAESFPRSFDIFRELCGILTREGFVEFLFNPNQEDLPVGNRRALLCLPDDSSISELTKSFEANRAIQFGGLINDGLLHELRIMIEQAPFRPQGHGHLGEDDNLAFTPLLAILKFILTDASVLRKVERIVGLPCGTAKKLLGRIYRMRPNVDEDGWHNDVNPKQQRLVAMTVQLNEGKPEGGNLLLRRKGRRRHFYATPALELGGVNIFRISGDLQHKVSRLKGDCTRIVFAGWYCSSDGFDYAEWVRRPLFSKEPSWAQWLKWLVGSP